MADQAHLCEWEFGFTSGSPIVVSAQDGTWTMDTSDTGVTLVVESDGVRDELVVNAQHLAYIRVVKRPIEPPPDRVSRDGSMKVSG